MQLLLLFLAIHRFGQGHAFSIQESTASTSASSATCSIEGHEENYLMLTGMNTSMAGYNLTINGGTGCQMRLLAVGGGGRGDANGGGSGFIQYHTIRLPTYYSPYTVSVSIAWTSNVTIYEANGFPIIVITALQGQDATQIKGGDGYSGGGASCFGRQCASIHPYPDGGENGSNGRSPPIPVGDHPTEPGHGSFLDLSTLHMQYFHLAPGRGGKADFETSSINGGGGGGVLINGEGPQCRSNDGEGYGGGGGGNHPRFYSGLGVVLLEIDTAQQE